MKKFSLLDTAALVVWLLPIAYVVYLYPSLPDSVPLHYGLNGTVNRYGSKSELVTTQAILLFVAALVYLLLKFAPVIDPKRKVKYSEKNFQTMAFGIVIFLSALNIIVIFSAAHRQFRIDKIIFPVIGLLFAFIGNVMHSIKPNYFAGFRTPWTLESGDTWRATHQLAGKLWFGGGIVITILTLVLSAPANFIAFMSAVGVLVFVPFIYSYLYFRKHPSSQH